MIDAAKLAELEGRVVALEAALAVLLAGSGGTAPPTLPAPSPITWPPIAPTPLPMQPPAFAPVWCESLGYN